MTGQDTLRIVSRETVRTGRYAILGADPGDADAIWFALHGYSQLAPRFIRAFEGLIPPGTCVVAPEGLSRFYRDAPQLDGAHLQRVGATWMTRESRETDIADAVRWLDTVHEDVVGVRRASAAAPRCAVLGFSQGVATAMRWIASGAVQPALFVAWAGGLASDVQTERFMSKLADSDVVLVAGEQDPFATAPMRAETLSAMRQLHPTVRELTFPGAHALDADVLSTLLREFTPRG